jgi:hypothetical protein
MDRLSGRHATDRNRKSQTMTDRPDAPKDTAANASPREEKVTRALPPAVWITGLIVLMLLLLAVFGLN